MNANDLVRSCEHDLNEQEARISDAKREIRAYIDGAEAQGQANLSREASARTEQLFTDIRHYEAAKRRAEARLTEANRVLADEQRINEQSRQVRDSGVSLPKYDEVARVGSEQRTYGRHNDPQATGQLFLSDVIASQVHGDPEATQRLARHRQEERVERGQYEQRAAGDATTAAGGGIVAPQYLVDLTGPAAAAMRPFADVCVKHPLPPVGMTLTIPVISTATSAAVQSTQLTAVSGTSVATTDQTLAVKTVAGFQNVSRQAADRSALDTFVMNDLVNRYHSALDSLLINEASTGLSAVAASTLGSFTSTSPTGALLYPKLLAAASGVEAACLNLASPTHALMHSRRWYWLAKEMTSTWPFINSQGVPPQSAGTDNNSPYASGVRGALPNGLRVLVSNNVPTNVSSTQDEIYIFPASEMHLFEDPSAPVYIRAEQPNAATLGILLVVFGYFAYCFTRMPTGAVQKCSGAGLTTPAF